jgi:hypothetical protein
MDKVRLQFRNVLEENEDVQRAVLASLRRKISEHFQYTPSSIPFEIFQNADDATIELNMMRNKAGLSPKDSPFVVSWRQNSLTFMHWGRPINKFREGTFDGLKEGFDRDLERMLLLNYSDKNINEKSFSVTGKFGLGFKSIFLATEKPRLRSGRLCLEIVAGMWPKKLSSEVRSNLAERLAEVRPDDRDGTLIELKETSVPSNEILCDFQRLAGILLAFSREIKQIHFLDETSPQYSIAWNPKFLDDSKKLSVADIPIDVDRTASTVLLIDAGNGAALFKFDTNGFGKLPVDIPTIWVTAPTEESSSLGFALNGQFPLDPGRAKLGHDSSRYAMTARGIGVALGEQLCELFDIANNDWTQFCKITHLDPDLKLYEFWLTFWDLVAEPFSNGSLGSGNEAVELSRQILWASPERGVGYLFNDKHTVPSGLWESFQTLTRIGDIEYTLVGCLCTENVFEVVHEWESAKELLEPGKTVSNQTVQVLNSLALISKKDIEVVTLQTLLEIEIEAPLNGRVSVEQANLIGKVLNREFLRGLQNGSPSEQNEGRSLLEILSTYMFETQDKLHASAKDLLVAHNQEEMDVDETLRAAFAPDSNVLNSKYTEHALELFYVSRERLNCPVERMKEWALSAKSDVIHAAVLQYLLYGERGRDLGRQLREYKRDTWIEYIQEQSYFQRLSKNEQSEIAGLLGLNSLSNIPELPPERLLLDPKEALERIYDWWCEVADEKTALYESKIYPSGAVTHLLADYENDDLEHRKSWISLFLLGMTHTIGRSRPEQHRGFLNHCRENGWLDVFASKDASAEKWIEVLENYIDNAQDLTEYSNWMRLFPEIYRVSKWAEEYTECFLAIERIQSPFQLREITKLRSSQRSQGGGYDAPDVSKSLGLGACFVTRELIRKNIIVQPLAHRHCYVPTGRVRDFVRFLGCHSLDDSERERNSIHIHEFVSEHLDEDRATFNLSFDLPFITLLDDENAQDGVLGQVYKSDAQLY